MTMIEELFRKHKECARVGGTAAEVDDLKAILDYTVQYIGEGQTQRAITSARLVQDVLENIRVVLKWFDEKALDQLCDIYVLNRDVAAAHSNEAGATTTKREVEFYNQFLAAAATLIDPDV